MAIAYLAIGSNIGDKEVNCARALTRLEAFKDIEIITRSRFYTTEPLGGPPQDNYLNGAVKIKTQICPDELLETVKKIEKDMGRDLFSGRDYPRIIDLDILLYDSTIMDTPKLTIPHPRMHERSFVLKGLVEIAPEVIHPVFGKTIEELYEDILLNRE